MDVVILVLSVIWSYGKTNQIIWVPRRLGRKGHWTENYTGTQCFITTLSVYSFFGILGVIESNFDLLISVQTFQQIIMLPLSYSL